MLFVSQYIKSERKLIGETIPNFPSGGKVNRNLFKVFADTAILQIHWSKIRSIQLNRLAWQGTMYKSCTSTAPHAILHNLATQSTPAVAKRTRKSSRLLLLLIYVHVPKRSGVYYLVVGHHCHFVVIYYCYLLILIVVVDKTTVVM